MRDPSHGVSFPRHQKSSTMKFASKHATTAVLLWSFFLSVTSQNANPSSSNKQFVPENVEENTVYCDIPPYQSTAFEPKDEMCENVVDDILGDEDAIQALAEAYAPHLYFHPLELFTMSSVNRTFGDPSKGQIFFNGVDRLIFDEELNQTSLALTTRDPDYVLYSHAFSFEHELETEYKLGDGFDENGLSSAPIYFRPFDSGNGTITFHYLMYYTWNGPTNMGILSTYNGTDNYVRLSLSPWGVHEGDWGEFLFEQYCCFGFDS